MIQPRCPLCASPGARRLFDKNGYGVHACAACDAGFVHPMPSREELERIYTLDYFQGNPEKFGYADYVSESRLQERNVAARVRAIESWVPGGRALDVGCANGSFLACLGPGWEKHGVELSTELLAASPPPPGVCVFKGSILDFPQDRGPFDLVTLFDLLDHVPSPRAVLEKVSRLVRPGGIAVALQGDRSSLFARLAGRRWHIYIPPTHLWFFTRAGLTRLFEEHGFETLRCDYEPRRASVALCLFRLRYMLPRRLGERLYRALAPTRLGRLTVRFNLRDVVTLYARRRAS